MLKYHVFSEPKEYPQKPVIFISEFEKPGGDNFSYVFLENKINEYLQSISLDITLILLNLEKKEEELYRQPVEFSWIIDSDFNKMKSNNVIVLDNHILKNILENTNIIHDYYKIQLENIYNYLKDNFHINEYFEKKHQYEKLMLKLNNKSTEKKSKI
jgi:hypothetical protein